MADVRLIDTDSVVEPDGTFPGAYGIYLVLSRVPEPAWQQEFERQWQLAPHGVKRRMTVIEDRLRITVGPRDHLAELMALAEELVEKTNQATASAKRAPGGQV